MRLVGVLSMSFQNANEQRVVHYNEQRVEQPQKRSLMTKTA
jgi:hypothetical protein